MPVIPAGVERFTIQPPLTVGDKGEPSESLWNDAQRVLHLIEDERHLVAHSLLLSVKQRLQEWEQQQQPQQQQSHHPNHHNNNKQATAGTKRTFFGALHRHHNSLDSHPVMTTNGGSSSNNNKRKQQQQQQQQQLQKEMENVKELLENNRQRLIKLEARCRIFRKAQRNLNVNDDWTFASNHFGITTYYRREPNGSLSIKLEGEIKDVPLFEQVCVLKEVDLHYKWSPFCSSSLTIADLDKLDVVGWFLIGLPSFGLARDGCFRAIGCDNIAEDGSILLAGQGIHDRPATATEITTTASPARTTQTADLSHTDHDIISEQPSRSTSATRSNGNYNKTTTTTTSDDEQTVQEQTDVDETYLSEDPILQQLDIPPIPTRRGSGRMQIRKFEAIIHVTSPTSAQTKIVANIDPRIAFLPQTLLEFVLKHLAGVILFKLQGAAKKVARNPVGNEHARKMREEETFYKDWLMPKFQAICDARGWEMPPVKAFELTDDQLRREDRLAERRQSRRNGGESTSSPDSLDIVENIDFPASDASSPHSDGDESLSALTSRSGTSFLTNNPIVAYLRERQEEIEERKRKEIQQLRQKAADRLRPKALPVDKQKRLEELKLAKARRLGDPNNLGYNTTTLSRSGGDGSSLGGTTASIVSDSERSPSVRFWDDSLPWWQRATSILFHQHGWLTQSCVISSLVFMLFLLLHPSLFPSVSSIRVDSNESQQPWWFLILEDIGAILYIGLCSVVHFILCDVALVYAFSALELGSKAGHQIKRYYRENVRFAVLIGSFFIYGFSIATSVLRVWLRALLWYSLRAFALARDKTWGMVPSLSTLPLPFPIPATVKNGALIVWKLYSNISALVARLLSWTLTCCRLMIRSNFVGQDMEYLTRQLFAFVWSYVLRCRALVQRLLDRVEGRVPLTSWRVEAFHTARWLFSYTAVFLLTSLLLFTLSARQSRGQQQHDASPQKKETTQTSSSSSVSDEDDGDDGDSERARVVGVSEPRYATIPEEEEVVMQQSDNDNKGRHREWQSERPAGTTGTKRSRLLFRRKRSGDSSRSAPAAAPSSPVKTKKGLRKTGNTSKELSRSKTM